MSAVHKIDFEVPGFDDVMKGELAIAREDVQRLERHHAEAAQKLGALSGQVAALQRQLRAAIGRRDETQLNVRALDRVLKQRQRLLFELEQENR